MTDEEILALASEYFTEESLYYPAAGESEWKGSSENLLKFASLMYNKGHLDGAYEQSKRYMEGVFDD